MVDMNAMNKHVIEEFRANNGKVGGNFEGVNLVLITTTGAKTRQPRTVPLVFTRDGARVIIIASFGGAEHHPPWFLNLSKTPELHVELPDGESWDGKAIILSEPERSEQFRKMAGVMPFFNEYQARTDRVIPVIALTRG